MHCQMVFVIQQHAQQFAPLLASFFGHDYMRWICAVLANVLLAQLWMAGPDETSDATTTPATTPQVWLVGSAVLLVSMPIGLMWRGQPYLDTLLRTYLYPFILGSG